jgi:hypothetical protein
VAKIESLYFASIHDAVDYTAYNGSDTEDVIELLKDVEECVYIEENTTTNPENRYEGAGAPSTFAPIGDVVWPLLLFALAYVTIKRRTKK